MFSNRLCDSSTHSLVLSDLRSAGRLTTDPIQAHGLSWTFLFLWEEGSGRIKWLMGFDQPPDRVVGVAVRASLVIESSRARYRRSSRCSLTCTEAQHAVWCYYIRPSQIKLLVEDGALKISTFLEVFKPVSFRSVPFATKFSIQRPSNRGVPVIVGVDSQGSAYLLCNLSGRNLSSLSREQWCVYSCRPCNPDRGVIIARLIIWRPKYYYKGSGFDRDNKKLCVTQITDDNSALQLDMVDCQNVHHTNRIYNVQEDQDLQWSAATPHKEGWLCIASGVRTHPRMVYHRFWLLTDDGQLKLLTELVRATPFGVPDGAASVNGAFYCLVAARAGTGGCRYLVFVSSWEQPHLWQPYELAPCPDFYTSSSNFYYEWGQILVDGRIYSGPTNQPIRQDALFKLRFEGADCYLEPYIVLPKGVVNWKMGIDGFVAITGGNELTLFGIQPPALKTSALMGVVKLLNGEDEEEKLTSLLGQATNAIRN